MNHEKIIVVDNLKYIFKLLLNQVYLLFQVRQVFWWGAGERGTSWKVGDLSELGGILLIMGWLMITI